MYNADFSFHGVRKMTLIILIGIIALLLWCRHILKIPKCGNMVLITGGIKTGKSTLSVRMVYKTWKRQKLKAKIFNLLVRTLGKVFKRFKKPFLPMPLIYSNVPLNLPYVPITQALLERRERFVYGSVAYIQECSLVADSMSFKDMILNERLLLLFKLWAHETHGGYIFLDTQSIMDNHYAIKRCLNSYFYIHHNLKIPFFVLMYVRELKYSEDGSDVNAFTEDIEEKLKIVVVPKSTWKLFDRFCYSVLTDDLPADERVVEYADDLKAREIVSFKKYWTIGEKENVINDDKK